MKNDTTDCLIVKTSDHDVSSGAEYLELWFGLQILSCVFITVKFHNKVLQVFSAGKFSFIEFNQNHNLHVSIMGIDLMTFMSL